MRFASHGSFGLTGVLRGTVAVAALLFLPFGYANAFTVDVYQSGGSLVDLAGADTLIAGAGSPTATGLFSTIDLDDLGDGSTGNFGGNDPWPGGVNTDFAARVTGNFVLGATDTWTFLMNHDDGARLTIDGTSWVTADGLADNRNTFLTINSLTAGLHSVEIVFFEHGGGASLEFAVAQGDTTRLSEFSLVESASVPEPSVLALIGIGLAGLGFARRRKA
jgi:hypothetical protein